MPLPGYGANLTKKGTVECDAAIMDGSGAFGSVGAVSGETNTSSEWYLEAFIHK